MTLSHQLDLTAGRFDALLGWTLRIGVLLSGIIVLTGGVLYLTLQHGRPADRRTFHGEPAELRHVSGILTGARHGESLAIMAAGLLLLVATPITRVCLSAFVFAAERDWTYVVLTLFVLALLLYSLLGASHGEW